MDAHRPSSYWPLSRSCSTCACTLGPLQHSSRLAGRQNGPQPPQNRRKATRLCTQSGPEAYFENRFRGHCSPHFGPKQAQLQNGPHEPQNGLNAHSGAPEVVQGDIHHLLSILDLFGRAHAARNNRDKEKRLNRQGFWDVRCRNSAIGPQDWLKTHDWASRVAEGPFWGQNIDRFLTHSGVRIWPRTTQTKAKQAAWGSKPGSRGVF